ncbi:MAG: type II toxin-antitoxin system RelE/ParE family toxin [Gammaproteobacteria bacterium]|nr:type II toxin-antitoxin system RelE/ParE family toxin [Gammaproteobacteria bacterium]
MTKVSVTFAESALRDLEEIQAWYERELVPEVGLRLVLEIFERVEALRDNPDMGRVVPEFDQKYLRELIHPPFRIVYKREAKKVRVVRVWRSERLLRSSSGAGA